MCKTNTYARKVIQNASLYVANMLLTNNRYFLKIVHLQFMAYKIFA